MSEKESSYYFSLLFSVGQAYGFELKTPWQELSRTQQEAVLFGTVEPILIEADSRYRKTKGYERRFEGVLAILERQVRDAGGESARQKLEKYQELVPAPPALASACGRSPGCSHWSLQHHRSDRHQRWRVPSALMP